jgi:hypothetical protein
MTNPNWKDRAKHIIATRGKSTHSWLLVAQSAQGVKLQEIKDFWDTQDPIEPTPPPATQEGKVQ